MSLNVSDLTAYVEQNRLPLIKKAVLGGRTLQYITTQPDVKSSIAINIINSDLVAQAGACGWNESGETILSQEILTVEDLRVNEAICLNTLETYYTQKLMQPGSYNEQIPFEQIYTEEKAEKVAALVEDLMWKGNTTLTGSTNLNKADGFLRKIDTVYSGSVVNGNVSGLTAITAANIVGIIDAINSVIPTDILAMDDLTIFVGYDVFRTYTLALRNLNLFHFTGDQNQGGDYTLLVPGSATRIVATRGLNGTNRIVATYAKNLYFGTDLLSDFEEFKIFYSEDYDEVRTRIKWKQGVAAAFPEFIVNFKLA